MENPQLDNVIENVKDFKAENTQILKKSITNELVSFKKTLPKEILTDELEIKAENEVNNKMAEFNNSIDIKPKALYYSLKSELELKEEASEKELTISAYEFLEKNTKNKILRRILRELKRETKK
ncbi:hypothetical protein VXN63_10705 [Marinilactibacillus sp. XAAS-LB27]|uniref:hypothetical protein n=1 Tax=Marinilactibacillus sp. XAAS-LB27 TaxID=3114538 RepID=UPI002E19547F|nr:hypothetical protein [Marinilactibacillus sp. XAAS-LB27]